MFEEQRFDVNGLRLNALMAGSESSPVIVFLHGFPSFSAMWTPFMAHFAQGFRCVAPDLRGFNRSSKPRDVAAYHIDHSTGDVVEMISQISPEKQVAVIGHDLGSYLAYHVAAARPDLVGALVVLNGPHPAVLAAALQSDPEQINASQYFDALRSPGIEAALADRSYAALLDVCRTMQNGKPLSDIEKGSHRAAWSEEGALTAMVNWYRANRFDVPPLDGTACAATTSHISMPHLVIWGEQDPYLRPVCHRDLGLYCSELEKFILPEAGHSPAATHFDLIIDKVEGFLSRRFDARQL